MSGILSTPSGDTTYSIATSSTFLNTQEERILLEKQQWSNPPVLLFLILFLIVLGTFMSIYAERRRIKKKV